MRTTINRLAVLTGCLIPACTVTPVAAVASVGAGVGAAPIIARAPAPAGATAELEPLYVKNTGSAPATYTVRVQRMARYAAHAVPARWVRLAPVTLRLKPGRIAKVSVSLAIPAGAAPGRYTTDLVAATYAPHAPGQPAIGAAAADKLQFSVSGTASSLPILPIVAGLLAAAILLMAGAIGRRRRALNAV
jgi:hypothetical protein